ncbi:unnamed protein product, partial [Candidula unifasciata]
GGVRFADLNREQAFKFQEDIIRTMMVVEETFHRLAAGRKQDTLLICDRGVMDGSAYLPKEDWSKMKELNQWNDVDLRDNRYNHAFYSVADHKTRSEDLEGAKLLDSITANAWVGHPYYDVIDNSTDFETKISRMIAAVCQRVDVHLLAPDLVMTLVLCICLWLTLSSHAFPHYQEFHVVHDYLVTPSRKMQARLRKRGQ